MRTTRDVLSLLREANPNVPITEHRLRHAMRIADIAPSTWGGRLAWSDDEIRRLAVALNVAAPAVEAGCDTTVPSA